MRVFDYNSAFAQLVDESIDPDTGEIINPEFEAQLAALEMKKEEQIEQIGLAFKNARADVEELDAVIKALQGKKAARERSMNFFKALAGTLLDGEKLKTPLVSMYWSRAKRTEIIDESAIPAEYLKTTTTIQKDAIKKAIQGGAEVPGAVLLESDYIVIK